MRARNPRLPRAPGALASEQGREARALDTRFEGEGETETADRGDWRTQRRTRLNEGFTELYTALDETTKTNEKIEALVAYFRAAAPEDAVWAIHFLIGRRIKRLIEIRKLVEWAIAEAGVPEWIFGDCYSAVGDLAETIALLLPSPMASTGQTSELLGTRTPPAAARMERRTPARIHGLRLARNGRAPALRLEQAHHR